MKNLKWIIPLAIVVVLLMVALPAAADDPFGGPPSKTSGNGTTTWGAIYVGGTWDNVRNPQYHDPSSGCFPTVAQGTANATTFGQVPGGAQQFNYPEPQALGTAQRPQPGIATQLNQPGQPVTMDPTGKTTATGVALIPGISNQNGQEFEVGAKITAPCGVNDAVTGVVDSVEYDRYVTNWSASTTIPGLSSRWFKFDTVKSRDVEVYVDDVPKWGAAYRYFDNKSCLFHVGGNGANNNGYGDCDKSDNLQRLGIDTSEISKYFLSVDDRMDFATGDSQFMNGISTRVYSPESITAMDYFWPTPNNALLTTRAGTRPRVGDTQGSYGGYNRGAASMLTISAQGNNVSYFWLEPGDQIKAGDGNTHLLSGKFHWDGWVYLRVFNNMYWDQNVVVGTRFTPNSKYDFPCANCPYPFNP